MSDPRKDEVDGFATFEFRGHEFKIPTDHGELSTEFLEALEADQGVGICRGALGAEQWAIARPLVPKVKDLRELSDLVAKALGFKKSGE